MGESRGRDPFEEIPSEEEIKKAVPVYVLAGNNKQFLEFCQTARLVPGHQAVYLSDERVLRGRKGPINLIKYGTFYSRVDASRIEMEVGRLNRMAHLHDVKLIGQLKEGDRVNVNDREFLVDSIYTDVEGNLQLTLILPTSRYVSERAVDNARKIPVNRGIERRAPAADEDAEQVHDTVPDGTVASLADGVATEE